MNSSGPLISPAAKSRVQGLIASAVEEGGQIHLDGRNVQVQGYPLGNFVGPTIIEATTTMRCYQYAFLLSVLPSIIKYSLFSAKKYLALYSLSSRLTRSTMLWKSSIPTNMGMVPPSSLNQGLRRASSKMRSMPGRLVSMFLSLHLCLSSRGLVIR